MSWYGVTSVCFGYFMILIYARIDQMIPEQNGPTDSAQVHVWWGIWLAAGAALRVQMERPSIGPWFTEFPGFDPQQLACNPCLNFKPISLSHIKQNICLKKQNKHIKKNKHMPRPSNDKSTEGMGVKHHFKGTWGGLWYDIIQGLAKMSHFLTSSNYWDFISNRYLKVMFKIPNSRGIYIGDWFDPLSVNPLDNGTVTTQLSAG
jgi:hypothetical protein